MAQRVTPAEQQISRLLGQVRSRARRSLGRKQKQSHSRRTVHPLRAVQTAACRCWRQRPAPSALCNPAAAAHLQPAPANTSHQIYELEQGLAAGDGGPDAQALLQTRM